MQSIRKHLAGREVFDGEKEREAEGEASAGGRWGWGIPLLGSLRGARSHQWSSQPGFPRCNWIWWKVLAPFQRLLFMCPVSHTPPCLLPTLRWTSHVMGQNNEVGLKQVWNTKSFKEMLGALRDCASLETPNPLQMRIFNPSDPGVMNHPLKSWPSACFTVSLAMAEGLSLWFSLRHTLSA